MTITTNFADFGSRERRELRRILEAWEKSGLPENFGRDGVRPMFNQGSGVLFLTNEDFDVAIVEEGEEGELVQFYSTPCDGREGTILDLLDSAPESYSREDQQYIREIAERDHAELPAEWAV